MKGFIKTDNSPDILSTLKMLFIIHCDIIFFEVSHFYNKENLSQKKETRDQIPCRRASAMQESVNARVTCGVTCGVGGYVWHTTTYYNTHQTRLFHRSLALFRRRRLLR